MANLLLFDADETLWTSASHDYVSSIPSRFKKINNQVVVRIADGKKFRAKKGVKEAFSMLHTHAAQFEVGIVSDNKPLPVAEVLRLFGLWQTVNKLAFNVRLWKGRCPKHEMVLEVLQQPAFAGMKPQEVYLVDDKDYSSEAKEIGIHFIRVGPDTDLLRIVKEILAEVK